MLLLGDPGIGKTHFAKRVSKLLGTGFGFISMSSLTAGWIIGGAVTIEYVFARPGLSSLLINSLAQRDYPVVQGCLLMLAIAVMLGTLPVEWRFALWALQPTSPLSIAGVCG